MNNKEKIEFVAKKYSLEGVKESLDAMESGVASNIVFLGEFSSGKTSLINKLLGTKLPEDTVATTKAICLIQPKKDLGDGEPKYYLNHEDGSSEEITALDFDERVRSDKSEGPLTIEVPPSKYLPAGVTIVDTPGEGSLSAESTITAAYLSQVDASVFCIPVSDGTLHRHAKEFLSSPLLARVHKRMVFALTMADTANSRAEVDNVKNQIVEELERLFVDCGHPLDDVAERVVPISSKVDGGMYSVEKLYPVLQKLVFSHRDEMMDERCELDCKSLVPLIVETLTAKYDAMSMDLNGIRARIDGAVEARKNARQEILKLEERFSEFRIELPERIGNAFDAYASALVHAKDPEQIAQMVSNMVEAIRGSITRLARLKLGSSDYTIDESFTANLQALLPALLARIDKTARGVADLAFIALSSGLAALAPGGAAAAEGAARGGAAVAARAGTQAAGKTAAKAAANAGSKVASAASKAVAEAAKSAGDAAKRAGDAAKMASAAAKGAEGASKTSKCVEILGKTAKVLSKVLDSVNPASYVADWTVPSFKEGILDSYRKQLTAHADDIADLMWSEYQTLVIEPAENVLRDKQHALEDVESEVAAGRAEFKKGKAELEADINLVREIM